MAVINGLPGVKVSIRLNGSGEDCPEYDDPKPPPTPASSGAATHSISKVIESKDDTNFSIHFEVEDAHRWIQDMQALVAMVKLERNIGVKREAEDEISPRMSKVYKTTADGAIDLTD
ncbi:hypothetical protein LZ31DRAFT_592330 [Colletotrichum somersetense]|nr:hypothetical protein LZ31DRAFT_592330 [Colletotrichum somersetense]